MNFDKKQKSEIRKTMKTLVKNMRTLWSVYPYEDINIRLDMPVGDFGDYWDLIINNKGIKLHSNRYKNITPLERKGKDKVIYTAGEYEAHYRFIMQYDEVEERIKRIITERASRSAESINKLREIQDKYSKDATIEIEVPETNNQHRLELTEENGQKVGTLSINGLTLKIIASNSVKIINKESQKVKRR